MQSEGVKQEIVAGRPIIQEDDHGGNLGRDRIDFSKLKFVIVNIESERDEGADGSSSDSDLWT